MFILLETGIKATFDIMRSFYERLRKPDDSLTKNVIKVINKATSEKRKEYSYIPKKAWDVNELKNYLEEAQKQNKRFIFFNSNPESIVEEIESFFVQLKTDEKSRIELIVSIIKLAQHYFSVVIVDDKKLKDFIGIRSIPQLETLIETSENIIEEKNDITTDFGDLYKEIIIHYKKEEYKDSLISIYLAQTNIELDEIETLALKLIEISIYYNQFEYKKAYNEIIKIEDRIPENISFQFLSIKGSILSEMGTLEGDQKLIKLAIEVFEKQLVALDRTEEDNGDSLYGAYYNLGTSYMGLTELINEEISISIEYFEAALELNNRNAELHKNLGTAYAYAHRYKDEVKCYERALELNPNLFEALCAMGYVKLYYYEDYNGAVKHYKKAFHDKENIHRSMTLFLHYASAYLQQKENKKALNVVNNGLKFFPTSNPLIEQKVEILVALQREKPKEYTSSLVEYISENFSPINGHYAEKIASAYFFAKDFRKLDDIINEWSKDVKTSHELFFIYHVYAGKLIEAKKNDKAKYIVQLLNNLDINKSEDPFIINLYSFMIGNLYSELEMFQKALKSYKDIDLSNVNEDFKFGVQVSKGITLLELESYREARIYFNKARKINPDNFELVDGLFQANIGLGQTALAEKSLMKMADIASIVIVNEIVSKEGNVEDSSNLFVLDILHLSARKLAHTKTMKHFSNQENTSKNDSLDRYTALFNSYYKDAFFLALQKVSLNVKQFPNNPILNKTLYLIEQQTLGKTMGDLSSTEPIID